MKFMIETMRLLLKHITLNQQITLAETFHTYFTTFQIAAPRRITEKATERWLFLWIVGVNVNSPILERIVFRDFSSVLSGQCK